MKRVCHYVRPNKISETPQRAIWMVLDIYELCHDKGLTVYDWNYAYCVFGVRNSHSSAWCLSSHRFTTNEDLWEWFDTITPEKTKTYLLTTNSDMVLTLLDMFKQSYFHHWKPTLAVIARATTIVRWRKDLKTLCLLDMLNTWPMPSFDISTGNQGKSRCDNDSATKLWPRDEEIKGYVNDMVQVSTAWWAFLKNNDLGGFAPTIGGQSLRTWRHKFMTHKVLIDCHDDALKLARDGLFGGRNECFFIGTRQGKFYQLDINSSYAAVMYNTKMPVQLRGYSEHSSVDELRHFVVDSVCVADVVVKTDVPIYPLRQDHQLFFPVGRFRTVLCGNELQHALNHDDVERVYRVSVYDGAYAFRDYMKSLWDERVKAKQRGDDAENERWKLLMASFFGKWSQRGRRWENAGTADDESVHYWVEIDADTREVTEYRQFGGIVQRCVYESESNDSSPAISACITAGARLSLWWLMQFAGRDHVYYVDTDSLLVDDVGYWRLDQHIDDAQLGGLHCEGEYTDIQILGPKHYRLDALWRHAGVREAALHLDESHIVQNESVSFAEAVRLGETQRTVSVEVSKTYAKAYTKGKVQEDGFVKPIQLEMKL